MIRFFIIFAFLSFSISLKSQSTTVEDDFEGNGTISSWYGDACSVNTAFPNPHQLWTNLSATVLEYEDTGEDYANLRFDVENNFDLSSQNTFSLKVFVPSSGLTGNQNNQISLKLQNGNIGEPWTSQCEIIKPIVLDQWQIITFDFENDAYINFEPFFLPPTQRNDFNRVVIQLNGENNNDHVLAYIDDFYYDGTIALLPEFDQLVWSDEFDSEGIDTNKWYHQTLLPDGGSWFNGEIQHYTDNQSNSFVEDGVLKIVAKKETYTDQGFTKEYTSARLNSKFAFKYGKVEVRAKLPTGIGTWPAIWMLGKNIIEEGAYWDIEGYGSSYWPACGEIDIMEHWGSNQNYVQSATHTPSSFGATENHGGQYLETASTEFHVYTLVWTDEKLVCSVDGDMHFTYNPLIKDDQTWPFDLEQYILLNIAIEPSISSSFTSSTMEIDYIRVYQDSSIISSVEVQKEQDFQLYPNPFSDQIIIRLKNTVEPTSNVKLYSIDGKLLREYKALINGNIIQINDLGDLQKGVYLLSFDLGGKVHSRKVFKF
jgi:beta-glucanase (GH16 family)